MDIVSAKIYSFYILKNGIYKKKFYAIMIMQCIIYVYFTQIIDINGDEELAQRRFEKN